MRLSIQIGWWALLVALLIACVTPTPPHSLTPTPPPPPPLTPTPITRLYPLPQLASPEYGIQTFLWWHVDNKTGGRDADLVRDLGFGWIKQEIPWAEMMHSRGDQYDWFRSEGVVKLAEERGLKLLARLGAPPGWASAEAPPGLPVAPDDFADFCGALAEHFAGRIAAYEVWNEPNLAREWNGQMPDPAGYVQLLKPCYLAIKQADPNAIIISAGLATTDCGVECASMPDMEFYQRMYEAGAAPYFDMLGAHAPGYMNAPEVSPDETQADEFLQSRVWTFRHVEDVRALMVANGDEDKQIAITEMGWTSDLRPDSPYAWHAVTEAHKAEYLVRAYQYAQANWSPWIGLMSAIYIADPEWTEADEQYWWAITRPTAPGEPADVLPAYTALQRMEK